jgi:hypothetical protein
VAAECWKKRAAQEIGNGQSVWVTTMNPLCIPFYSVLFYSILFYYIHYFLIKVCYVKNVADVEQNTYVFKNILHIFHLIFPQLSGILLEYFIYFLISQFYISSKFYKITNLIFIFLWVVPNSCECVSHGMWAWHVSLTRKCLYILLALWLKNSACPLNILYMIVSHLGSI